MCHASTKTVSKLTSLWCANTRLSSAKQKLWAMFVLVSRCVLKRWFLCFQFESTQHEDNQGHKSEKFFAKFTHAQLFFIFFKCHKKRTRQYSTVSMCESQPLTYIVQRIQPKCQFELPVRGVINGTISICDMWCFWEMHVWHINQ